MHKFCTIINNGYSSNFKTVNVPLVKKYLFILKKLVQYNCIKNYKIFKEKNLIEINLKYYNNKPLFRLFIQATNSNKNYHKFFEIHKKINQKGFQLMLFSTNIGFLTSEEIYIKNLGGNKFLMLKLLVY
jgi:ribosomal protein S8